MIILVIIKSILSVLGIISLLPSVFLFPALLITAIIGAVKNDFSYLKRYLKIWGYSLLAFVAVIVLYSLCMFLISSILI